MQEDDKTRSCTERQAIGAIIDVGNNKIGGAEVGAIRWGRGDLTERRFFIAATGINTL